VTVTNEVAGLGGDEHFSKMEVHSEFFREIVRDCVSASSWSFTPEGSDVGLEGLC